jgi:hypothetical protein
MEELRGRSASQQQSSDMKWFNAREQSPRSEDPVLVHISGMYYICTYDRHEKIFRLGERLGQYFDPGKEIIFWTEISGPVKT